MMLQTLATLPNSSASCSGELAFDTLTHTGHSEIYSGS